MKTNIRHIKAIAATLLIGGVMASCADDIDLVNPDDYNGPAITLTIDTNDSETRALTGPGDYSPFTVEERKLHTVDVYFYKEGDPTPVRFETLTDKVHNDKVTFTLNEEEAKAIFGLGDIETDTGSCRVFAVANVSDADYTAAGITDKTTATIAQLKAIKANTPGFKTEFNGFAMITKDENGDVITYAALKAEGKIKLRNLAAKIDVFVNFTDGIAGEGGKSWHVVQTTLQGVGKIPTAEVHLLNGVTAVGLSGYDPTLLTDDDYYSIRIGEGDTDYLRGLKPLTEHDPYYEKGARWVSANSYYSYPNSWEDTPLEKHATSMILKVDWTQNAVDNPDELEPEDIMTTYYNVPLDLKTRRLESNHYYRLNLNINTLGGENIGEPLEIEGTLEVLPWGHVQTEADIRELRYLQCTQKQIDRDGATYTAIMYGTDMVSIPFETSHKAVIDYVTISYTNYREYTDNGKNNAAHVITDAGTPMGGERIDVARFTKTYDQLVANNWQCAYIDDINKTLIVRHPIGAYKASTVNGVACYTPDPGKDNINNFYSYVITIKLKHDQYDRDFPDSKITIMHHPAIYVEGEINKWYNDTGSGKNDAVDRKSRFMNSDLLFGFARVNNNSYDNAGYGGLDGISKNWEWSDLGAQKTENPIMYIVNVTNLSDDDRVVASDPSTKYHLKDPRVLDPNPLQSSGWASAPHWRDGRVDKASGHTIHAGTGYYYPTDKSEDPQVKYGLSPRFRMASSFGTSSRVTKIEDAEKRCASYQEAGYPAGRWRLPTYGEMAYVSWLGAKGLIPPLFGGSFWGISVDRPYWTAHGAFKVNKDGILESNSGGLFKTIYVRCVYDDWYWVKQDAEGNFIPDKIDNPYNVNGYFSNGTVFIWGDKEKKRPSF